MATTIELKSQKTIQTIFDYASAHGIQHYHWIPPEAADVQKDNWLLEDNAKDADGMFHPYPGYALVQQFVDTRSMTDVESDENADPETTPGKDRKTWKWPKSTTDTTHVDPVKKSADGTAFDDDELEKLEGELKDNPGKDKRVKFLRELARSIGPKTIGMRRLDLIFEWIILRATVLLNDIDKALDQKSLPDYTTARNNYLNFLRDLDDHEPGTKQETLDPDPKKKTMKSGYGRHIKWTYIAPVIEGGRVHAVRVIAHWNPHSSSLGVPVKHP